MFIHFPSYLMIMILNVNPGFIKPRLLKVGVTNVVSYSLPGEKIQVTMAWICRGRRTLAEFRPQGTVSFPHSSRVHVSQAPPQDVAEPKGEATEGEEKEKKPKKKSKGSWNRVTIFDPWQNAGRMLDFPEFGIWKWCWGILHRADTQTDTQTRTQTETETDTDRDRQTDRHTDRDRDTETQRHRHTH